MCLKVYFLLIQSLIWCWWPSSIFYPTHSESEPPRWREQWNRELKDYRYFLGQARKQFTSDHPPFIGQNPVTSSPLTAKETGKNPQPRKRNSATDVRLHTGRGHQSGSASLRSSLTPVPCTEKPLKMQESSLVQPRAEKQLPSLPLWFCWFVIYRHSSLSTLFSPKSAGWKPREQP